MSKPILETQLQEVNIKSISNREYEEAIDWLYSQLPNYQTQGENAYKPGLERVLQLAAFFGNPQNKLKVIHVAGTNGKGSCSHMLASILQEQGYKVGLFTSPHFKNFTERIRINGKEASPFKVLNFLRKIRFNNKILGYSFFEITTIMAFEIFAREKVDFAIIETGLGGRLDATNIVTPILSVITSISLDHTSILGDSISKIAFEKAGIIKKGVPVVLGKVPKEASEEITRIAQQKNSVVYFSNSITSVYPSDLQGNYQIENQKTVLKSIEVLRLEGFCINEKAVQQGLLHVKQNTGLRGRWEVQQKSPTIIWDAAHNPDGIQHALMQLKEGDFQNIKVLLGFVKGKEIDKIIPILQQFPYQYTFTQPTTNRGLSPSDYQENFQNIDFQIIENPKTAYEKLRSELQKEDALLVMGSNFLIADLID